MAEPVDIATKIKFSDICRLLQKVQDAKTLEKKDTILKSHVSYFLNEFCKEFREKNITDVRNSCFYPILRLLLPAKDSARESYGLQITSMGKLYIKVLNIGANSDDAKKLNYTSSVNGCKDFADVVHNVMKKRTRDSNSDLTLAEIHKLLDIISNSNRSVVDTKFTELIEKTSAFEQKWFIRIILKRLYLGIGEQKIFSIYHPKAKQLYDRHTNLLKVCEIVESGEPIDITDEVAVDLFQHMRPMLCQSITDLDKLPSLLEKNIFYLETKMDGERFQLHMSNGTFKYISRNGKDYTSSYGSHTSEGNLTPVIAKLLDMTIKNIILDGEMMVWDIEDVCYRVKGENIDVKSLSRGGKYRPCFVIYDILYMNDKLLIDKPYADRILLMQKMVREEPGVLLFCKRELVKNVDHLKECFNQAVETNEEGVVIKNQMAKYQPGIRNGGGWYKIKPDYINGLTTDFDLLIIGGYYNRKRTWIQSYLLGVYKKSADNDDESVLFYAVGKVGLGLSNLQRKHINQQLRQHLVDTNNKNIVKTNPDSIDWGAAAKPDFWIDPRKSIILQIKAAELTANSKFKTSKSLRFPRIQAVRNDKSWNECCTLDEFEEFCKTNRNVDKLTKRQLNNDDFSENNKRLKITKGQKKNNEIDVYSTKFQPNEITKMTKACEGINFVILSTAKGKPSIDELKKMVIKHGGSVIANPIPNTQKCVCVAGDLTFRVKSLIKTCMYNIVKIDWFIRAFKDDTCSAEMVQLRPRDMICTTRDMEEEFKKLFDKYGDSFTNPVNKETLTELFDDLNGKIYPELLESEILEIEKDIYNKDNLYNIYRTIFGYFYEKRDESSKMVRLAKLAFQARGGTLLDVYNIRDKHKITHVFVENSDLELDLVFQRWLVTNLEYQVNNIKFVNIKWVLDSDKQYKRLDVMKYLCNI